jgi:predicted GIY-YIG superfamily endonuclease
MQYVYILLLNNGDYYKGCTNNLKERLKQHEEGKVTATKDFLPFSLITYIVFTNKYTAFNFEKYLKSGSGIAFMYKRLI